MVIGPVSVASATAWLDYADEVIDELAAMAPGECFTTSEVLEVFRGYLTSWRAAAVGTDLVWERDIAPEQVEYDMHAFQRVVDVLSRRAAEGGRAEFVRTDVMAKPSSDESRMRRNAFPIVTP